MRQHGGAVSVMKRGVSSSWNVAPSWDVAPEELAMDGEGAVQLTHGQEFVNEFLKGSYRGVMNLRALSFGIGEWSV